MSTIASLISLLDPSAIKPWYEGQQGVNREQSGRQQAQTGLIELQQLKEKQQAEQLFLERIKNDPALAQQLLGGGSVLGSLGSQPGAGGMPAPAPMTQQTTMPGQPPGQPQQVPGGQDLSQFATQGVPGQSVLGSLGPAGQAQMQAPRNPVLEMAATNPRAAMMMEQQLEQRQDLAMKRQEQRLKMGSAMMESLGQMAQGVTDQAGWDQLRQDAAQISPQLAARVEPVYSKEGKARLIAQATGVKDSLTLQVQDLAAQAAVIKARKEGRSTEVDNQLRAMGVPPGQETPAQMKEALQAVQQGKVDVSAAQGVGQAQQRSLGETAGRRLEAYDKAGMAGQDMHTVLDEAERLIGEGVYGNSLTDQTTMAAYKRGLFQDDKKAQRTARLQELGSQLVLAHGSLGSGVSTKDAEIYAKAAGNFQQAKNLDEMKQSIQSMRTIGDTAIRNANAARESYEKTGRLPAFQERGTQAQPQGQASAGGATGPATFDRADFLRWRQGSGKTGNPTQADVEAYFQAKGLTRR